MRHTSVKGACITFAGAAREVTGSCHVVQVNGKHILLDCGLFQGRRHETHAKNLPLPLDVSRIDAVVLSHAHIDHAGRIPPLVREGYRGTVWCTAATRDLAAVMLADSAHTQEQDAEFLTRHHKDAVPPLYSLVDATRTADLMAAIPYHKRFEVTTGLFESHTDVIVKDRRETYYGHKIFLTGGASGLILDCAITKGNPADSTWTVAMLKRQQALYGQPPRQATLDGGFASGENLTQAKTLGVSDVCFAKRRGLAVLDMVKSSWVYRKLKRFRAGIESVISLLKRAFGLDRCIWKGATGFHAYVRLGVLTANLLTLARHQLA